MKAREVNFERYLMPDPPKWKSLARCLLVSLSTVVLTLQLVLLGEVFLGMVGTSWSKTSLGIVGGLAGLIFFAVVEDNKETRRRRTAFDAKGERLYVFSGGYCAQGFFVDVLRLATEEEIEDYLQGRKPR